MNLDPKSFEKSPIIRKDNLGLKLELNICMIIE